MSVDSTIQTKQCIACNLVKPLTGFNIYFDRRHYFTQCKLCNNLYKLERNRIKRGASFGIYKCKIVKWDEAKINEFLKDLVLYTDRFIEAKYKISRGLLSKYRKSGKIYFDESTNSYKLSTKLMAKKSLVASSPD